MPWKYRQMHGFYDPDLNAHFYFLAGDSHDNGCMPVYRYRRADGSGRATDRPAPR